MVLSYSGSLTHSHKNQDLHWHGDISRIYFKKKKQTIHRMQQCIGYATFCVKKGGKEHICIWLDLNEERVHEFLIDQYKWM